MEYDELVDSAAYNIMKALIAGKFRDGVWIELSRAIEWKLKKQEEEVE